MKRLELSSHKWSSKHELNIARSSKYGESSAQADSFLHTHAENEEFIKKSSPSLEIQVKELPTFYNHSRRRCTNNLKLS